MKRIILILSCVLCALTISAQTIGEAFYIYRNDGNFNAFFREEIDSIVYSQYDADSLLYEDIVTQLVYTEDSVYRIPLAAIDSVSFVTPKTIYKAGVKVIDSLADYVLSSDETTFVLSNNTPQGLVPLTGDKIVTTEQTEAFPNGFAGEVVGIDAVEDGIRVVCSGTSITDLYEIYFGTTYRVTNINNNFTSKVKGADGTENITIAPGKQSLDLKNEISVQYNVNNNLSFSFTPDLAFDVDPIWQIRGFVIVTPQTGLYASAVCTADYYLEERLGGTGSICFKKDFPIPILSKDHIPVVPPYLFYYEKAGAFLSADFSGALKCEWSQHFRQVFVFEYSSKGEQILKQPSRDVRLIDSSHCEEGYINGTASAGMFVELGFTLADKKIDRVDLRGELGFEASDQAVIYKKDFENASHSTALYEQMYNSALSISQFMDFSIEAAAGPWGVDWTPVHLKLEMWRMNNVPEFSEVKADWNTEMSQIKGSMKASGKCFNPMDVGLTLVDEDGNHITSDFASYSGENTEYQFDISNVSPKKKYTMYPSIKIRDYFVLAKPTCEIDIPVKITDFKVTSSQYEKNGFEYNGIQYDYNFNVSVTTTIYTDDISMIADWGYAYLDPNGNEARISLKNFGTTYTDNRYAYCRNKPHSSCTLYGYVKYVGSDEIIYGKAHDYKLDYIGNSFCPDSNHPHWIDLGLPSGTLWCCCNEGARFPDELGEKCTFAQASTAPNRYQLEELREKCWYFKTEQNGVPGFKFVGNNRNAIFLPVEEGYYDQGTGLFVCPHYWSSTLVNNSTEHALVLTLAWYDYRSLAYVHGNPSVTSKGFVRPAR